jgi:23S rRNA (uracil1939-C5)-methyltransferase
VHRTISLPIDSIASGGDGVGRAEGLVVFVPRTAPGDVVTASVTGKGHFARGTLRNVVRPSSARIDPPCVHYTRDRCGGCQLQHVSYEAQLEAKQRMIVDAMRRIGKREIDSPVVHPSTDEWRYRAKLTMALRKRAGQWIAGLHAYDDPGRVFPVADCPITDRRVVAAWREVMQASELFPDAPDLRGSIRWTSDGPIFVLMGGRRWPLQHEFFEAVPTLAALYWEPAESARVTVGDRRTNRTPAASFAQVNPSTANTLRRHVAERVLSYHPASVVDAYSGNGDLSVTLAEAGIAVTAIELDADASAWAEARLPASSRAVRARVEEVLPHYLPADLVVLNPPRAGVHGDVPTTVNGERGPRTIVYVSCDPATLSRDVARMPGYRVASIVAFDMFPQTSHVETVCELVRESA